MTVEFEDQSNSMSVDTFVLLFQISTRLRFALTCDVGLLRSSGLHELATASLLGNKNAHEEENPNEFSDGVCM